MSDSKFATAINCMDGRVQQPVFEWMKEQFSVEYIDMITEAGPNKVLLEGTEREVESIQSRVQVSYEAHGSEVVAIVGHYGCAGNPVPKDELFGQIEKSVEKIKNWGLEVKVLGLYVNENWEVEVVKE
ncbi:carbonic anhydrase [Halobacillus ihumii]|uniref:carbonic anhydrase n=1 Tax=Halobacillus ihumii TaxID=2686092 RepID=UPI0013D2C9AB|nr:carbonic anhydrase [Halobacillus ihumii]